MTTIAEQIENFGRARRGSGKSAYGVLGYQRRLLLFDQWLAERGARDLSQITELVVLDYRDHMREDRGNAMGTVMNSLVAIRAFCLWAVKQGHMAEDPTREIATPRPRRRAPKPLTSAELATLRSILAEEPEDEMAAWHHRRNRLAILLMYYAGLRLGEVARLKVDDVNLLSGLVTIRQSKSDDRSVALHTDLLGLLADAIAGKRPSAPVIASEHGQSLSPKVLSHVFHKWLLARGLRISAHRLRHTFATELLRACGNLGIVQDALGHASPETTRIYTLIVVDDQRPAINKLPRLFAASSGGLPAMPQGGQL